MVPSITINYALLAPIMFQQRRNVHAHVVIRGGFYELRSLRRYNRGREKEKKKKEISDDRRETLPAYFSNISLSNGCNHVETKVAFRHSKKGVTRLRSKAPRAFLPASKPVPPVPPKNRHVFKSTRG